MNTLIIEDETPTANRLKNLLVGLDDNIEIVDILPSIKKTVEWLGSNITPDIIFMDIELLDGRCFEIFKQIKVSSPVIFTTAYDQFALKALKLNALDYLLKPIDKNELKEALEKLRKTQKTNGTNDFAALVDFVTGIKPKKVAVKDATGTRFIEIGNIVRLQADSNYTLIFLADKTKVMTTRTLKDYEDILSDYGFFRAHNTHLINLDFVEKFFKDTDMVQLSNGNTIEVSRYKKKELLLKLGVG
jgi:two-component system LytT family response regulator